MSRGGIGGKIVCLLLGFVLGVGGTIGGVAGVGYYIGTQPIDEAAKTVDSLAPSLGLSKLLFGDEEKDGIINDVYAEQYVKDLVGDTAKALKNLSKGGSLSDFEEISPKISELVDKLLKVTDKYGIPMDKEELMSAPLLKTEGEEDLGKYFLSTLKSTPIASILSALGNNPEGLFTYLCYGEEGVDYKVVDGEIVMINGSAKTTIADLMTGDLMPLFAKVPLSVVATPTIGDSMMLTLVYGREGVTYDITNSTDPVGTKAEVTMLDLFYELSDGKFVDYTSEEVDGSVVDSDEAGYIKFQLPTEEGEDASYIYLKEPSEDDTRYYAYRKTEEGLQPMLFPKTKLSDLTSNPMGIVDKILLKDVLNVESPDESGVLESLCFDKDGKAITIGELRNNGSDLINNVPLSSIIKPSPDNNMLLYLLYGHNGIHFDTTVSGGSTTYTMRQKFIGIYDGKVYDEYGYQLDSGTYTLASNSVTIDGVVYYYNENASETFKLKEQIPAGYDVNEDGNVDANDTVNATSSRYYLKDSANNAVMFKETYLGDFNSGHSKLDTITKHLTVRDIFGDDSINAENNNILKALADCCVGDIGSEVKNIKIKEIFGAELEGNTILSSLGEATLTTLPSKIDNLTILDIFGKDAVDSNKILHSLQGTNLKGLPDAINDLTMADIFEESEINSNSILKNLSTYTLTQLPSAITNLTVEQVLHDTVYNYDKTTGEYFKDAEHTILVVTYDPESGKYYDADGNEISEEAAHDLKVEHAINTTWKYLLRDKNGVIHTEYKVTEEMNHLIDNMVDNIHDATLNDLDKDGFIDFDEDTLGADIIKEISVPMVGTYPVGNVPAGKDYLGELTVEELLLYVSSLIETMSQAGI